MLCPTARTSPSRSARLSPRRGSAAAGPPGRASEAPRGAEGAPQGASDLEALSRGARVLPRHGPRGGGASMRRPRTSWRRHGRHRLFRRIRRGICPPLTELSRGSAALLSSGSRCPGGRRRKAGPCPRTEWMAALRGRGALVHKWVRACTTGPASGTTSAFGPRHTSGSHLEPGPGRNEGPLPAPARTTHH
jgi:hypothetical protein